MDPASLGAMAVSILAPYLSQAGSTAAQKIGAALPGEIEHLLDAVRKRFGAEPDPYATQTLARLEQQPAAAPRQRALADVLAEKAEADPAFRTELERLVDGVRSQPASMQFLTQVSGGEVGEILNIGSVTTLNLGRDRRADDRPAT